MPKHLLQMLNSGVTLAHQEYLKSLTAVQLYTSSDLTVFLQQEPEDRIAVVELDYADKEYQASRKLFNDLRSCQHVIVHSMEYNIAIQEIILDYDLPNFEWHTPSAPPLKHSVHSVNLDWFIQTAHPYFYEPNFIATNWQVRTHPNRNRERTFDVMLGQRKPHREFCKDWIQTHISPENYYMGNFFTQETRVETFPTDSVFREPEMSAGPVPRVVEYLGKQIFQPLVLPLRLYEQTQHSVVCETWYDVCFPTEKTCKPILAQRLFVVLSCVGYLQHLRELGFQTFGDIIDESYDSEPNDTRRWTMALEQMRSLIGRPWPDLWAKLQPVVEHNLQHLRTLPAEVLLQRVKQAID